MQLEQLLEARAVRSPIGDSRHAALGRDGELAAATPRTAAATISFVRALRMQRIWRDANTAGRYAMINLLVIEEVYGKALLGFSPEEQVTDLI